MKKTLETLARTKRKIGKMDVLDALRNYDRLSKPVKVRNLVIEILRNPNCEFSEEDLQQLYEICEMNYESHKKDFKMPEKYNQAMFGIRHFMEEKGYRLKVKIS